MSVVAVKAVAWHATMGTPVRLRAERRVNTTTLLRAEVDVTVLARNTGGVEYGVRQRLVRRVGGRDPHQSTP